MPRQLFIACNLVILSLLVFAGITTAQDDQPAYWLSADDIQTRLFNAQSALLTAHRAADPQHNYQRAADQFAEAQAIYVEAFQSPFEDHAAAANDFVIEAFEIGQTAAAAGDSFNLAAASGHISTGLWWGSYEMTLRSLDQNDIESARAWLRLRMYRQSTRVSRVDNRAGNALDALEIGDIKLPTAVVEVGDDLRDAYFFRGREALLELEAAVDNDLWSRAAEWAGQARGYLGLLNADYATKLGDAAAADLQTALIQLETTVIANDLAAVQTQLETVHEALNGYQPVRLTSAEIAERGAMLYMFNDLVYREYRDAVRDGVIINAIEYQEAHTFRDQAQTIFEEIRPEIAQNDSAAAQRLDDLLQAMAGTINSIGPRDDVKAYVEEAGTLIESALDLNTGATNASAAFPIIDTLLDSMVTSVQAGRYAEADQIRLEAYAIFDFGPEPRLAAFAPDLIMQVEGLFWQGYNDMPGLAQALANDAPAENVVAIRAELDQALANAQVIVNAGASEPATVITNAAIIVFREGLEAVVILAALMAGMVGVNQHYRRPLLAGSGIALVASLATWWLAQNILDLFQAYGEKLEAVVAIIAIAVLLLITNWFFHKVYWTQWIAHFHKQKRSLLGREVEIGQLFGLVLLGFTSVYREGFETVLFLQALTLDMGAWVVIQGVLLGLIAVGLVGVVTFRLQRRLPYRKMLVVTGILIGVVLVAMIGNTVHIMQVVGWLPITPLRGIILPSWLGIWFGVFPTWQGLLAQFSGAAFVIGSYYLAEFQAARHRRHTPEQAGIEKSPSAPR